MGFWIFSLTVEKYFELARYKNEKRINRTLSVK